VTARSSTTPTTSAISDDVALLRRAAAIAELNRAERDRRRRDQPVEVARGWLSTDDYDSGATADRRTPGARECPDRRDARLPALSGDHRSVRLPKARLRLFRDAIADLGIDPSASVFIGDRWRDISPATALGGRRSSSTWRPLRLRIASAFAPMA
jgi:hypothetical protein